MKKELLFAIQTGLVSLFLFLLITICLGKVASITILFLGVSFLGGVFYGLFTQTDKKVYLLFATLFLLLAGIFLFS